MTPKVKRLHVLREAEDGERARFRAIISLDNFEGRRPNRIEITAHSLETLIEKLSQEREIEWRGDKNELRRTLMLGCSFVAESFSRSSC